MSSGWVVRNNSKKWLPPVSTWKTGLPPSRLSSTHASAILWHSGLRGDRAVVGALPGVETGVEDVVAVSPRVGGRLDPPARLGDRLLQHEPVVGERAEGRAGDVLDEGLSRAGRRQHQVDVDQDHHVALRPRR